jgi:hypothetical protein
MKCHCVCSQCGPVVNPHLLLKWKWKNSNMHCFQYYMSVVLYGCLFFFFFPSFVDVRMRCIMLTLSDPTSDLVRHCDFPLPLRCRVTSDTFLCCVCAPAPLSEPVRHFPSCTTDFSQQVAQVVLFLFHGRYAVGRKIGWERVKCFESLPSSDLD